MKPIYLYDVGIKPWEQTSTVNDRRFATITIVQRSVSELFGLWLMLITSVSQRLPKAFKWRTVGHSIEGSKVQELKLLKQLKSDLSNSDFIDRNEESNIYSYVKRLSTTLSEFDLNTITQPRYTVLLFLPDSEPSIDSIWKSFKDSDAGLDAEGIENSFCSFEDLMICRVVESDTHVGAQFIGAVEQVDRLLEKLNELGVNGVRPH
ncbi:hypothetical protein [Motiliproteus sp. MSK22-1]|uniref:hypothetical protein n=1 Tax=Motiliproteus sp. MSK22-1 TaxID=1897630 RepID=UPI000978C8E3|nr:hypothetical protein [Motiliproteus sp. MSK22-1]OMH38971.1 hypothetical protein BGP75_04390 [Motiliproteus sp. MSK22-1]